MTGPSAPDRQMVPMRLLVIAAHPDDEVLGCGATVALRKAQGWEPHLLVMTRGVLGREPAVAPAVEHRAAIAQLSAETAAAARVLGFVSVENLDFPDNRLDTVGRNDVALAIKSRLG